MRRNYQMIRVKKIKIALILATVAFLFLSMLSLYKFHVLNPFNSIIGLAKIYLTDTEIAIIQEDPQIVLSKPYKSWDLFLEMLENEGYNYIEDKRMGSMHYAVKDDIAYNIVYKVNGYYSLWEFNEN